jgi:hypothetical protein
VAGQPVFSDEEMLATLMEYWSVYQGAHEGWILDEYTVTYPWAGGACAGVSMRDV